MSTNLPPPLRELTCPPNSATSRRTYLLTSLLAGLDLWRMWRPAQPSSLGSLCLPSPLTATTCWMDHPTATSSSSGISRAAGSVMLAILKGHFIFKPSIFREYLSFQKGYCDCNHLSHWGLLTMLRKKEQDILPNGGSKWWFTMVQSAKKITHHSTKSK